MRARILGTAAGGGLPQWNCACPSCAHARRLGRGRTQDCLAISGDGRGWYLVNASPDLRTQILATPELAPPPGTRDSPLRGVLLTSAELDHTLGLLTLREADRLTVFATQPVRTALHEAFSLGPTLAAYTDLDWRTIQPGEVVRLDGGLRATAFPLSDKRPRYAPPTIAPTGDDSAAAWTVAYRFTDDAGATLVYAPGLAALTPTFREAMAGADVVLLDGTFATDDEMAPRSGRGMGHLPIAESLPVLAGHPGPRYFYTHLNNTNPLNHPEDPRHAELAHADAAVATDGHVILL